MGKREYVSLRPKGKVTYFGWKNVPSGVLVKTRDQNGVREFFLKISTDSYQSWAVDGEIPHFRFPGYNFDPDDWTTGTYKLVK